MPVSIFSESPFVDEICQDLETDQTEHFKKVYDTLKRITKVSFTDQYESIKKIGQGTFGEVFKARNKASKLFVAMKRIKTETEKEGFPITAVREIRLLLSLNHENIISLKEVCCSSITDEKMFRPQFYLVFEYCDHDLAGLTQRVQFANPVRKQIMLQLLNGIFYLHRNNVIHRDLKAANILINKHGVLKIADFGLARTTVAPLFPDRPVRYTSRVVTLWYRPPEILLNDKNYGKAVDMWGVGCIMVELWTKFPIMQGDSELNQLSLILSLCGPITPETWPGVERLQSYRTMNLQTDVKRRVKECLRDRIDSPTAIDLIDRLLVIDPSKRLTADAALSHDYFYEDPPPGDLTIFSRDGGNYLEYFTSAHHQRSRQPPPQQQSQMRHNQRPMPYGYNPGQGRPHDHQQRRQPNIPHEDIIHRDRIY